MAEAVKGMDRAELVQFVKDECGGSAKRAAERLGVSVSRILATAPELKTPAQMAFDVKEARFGFGPWEN